MRAALFQGEGKIEIGERPDPQIEVPTDAGMSAHREWLLIRPRTDWTVGSTTYAAGSLLAANYEEFLSGTVNLSVIFEPDEHTSRCACQVPPARRLGGRRPYLPPLHHGEAEHHDDRKYQDQHGGFCGRLVGHGDAPGPFGDHQQQALALRPQLAGTCAGREARAALGLAGDGAVGG